MRKIFAIILMLYAFQGSGFALDTTPSAQHFINISYGELDYIEEQLFRRRYFSENIELRLNRIEDRMFKRRFNSYTYSQRIDNIRSFLQETNLSSSDKRVLKNLEKRSLSRTYESESPTFRVERLERNTLGTIQNGDLSKRISLLNKVISRNTATYVVKQNFPYFYNTNPRFPHNSRQIYRPRANFRPLQSLRNYFIGYPTGVGHPVYNQGNPNQYGLFNSGGGGQNSWVGTNGIGAYNHNVETTGNSSVTVIKD